MDAYCLPVRPQHDRFVAEHTTAVYQLPKLRTFMSYFDKHYRERADSVVEIGGVTYCTTVYSPDDVDDSYYAVVGPAGVPTSKESLPGKIARLTRSYLQSYWERIKPRVEYGDSLTAASSSYIPGEFIPPSFTRIDMTTGRSAGVLSWGDLQQHARLVVLGSPGSGKTTCLRMLVRAAVVNESNSTSERIPIFITLRDLEESEPLLARAARLLDLKHDSPAFKELISSGRAMLLCDGLDEVEERRGSFIGQLLELSRSHTHLGMAISTRDTGYYRQFPGFLHVRIGDFSKADRAEWIRRRIGAKDKGAAYDLINTLESTPDFDEAISGPLGLLLVATVFEGSGVMPRRTSDVALRYIGILLEKWDAERGVQRWKHRPFELEGTLRVLCRTAFNCTLQDLERFSGDSLSTWEAEWSDKVDPGEFLNYIWKGSSLLKPADHGTWYFQSSVIRDVLCAKHLVERTDDPLRSTFLRERISTLLPAWRYACEISHDASPVIESILHERLTPAKIGAFVASVIIEDIAVKKNVERDVCKFLVGTLASIATDLELIKREELRASTQVIRAKTREHIPLLRDLQNILLPLVSRGRPGRRRTIAQALASCSDEWIVSCIVPSMDSETPSTVEVDEGIGILVIERLPGTKQQ